MEKVVLIAALFCIALSIEIPVNSREDKCMIVFSTSAEDYLKIDMKFDRFTAQTNQ
jgi:hypothetical protein